MNLIIVSTLTCFFGIVYGFSKSVPVYKLNNGHEMPKVGFGTFLMTPNETDLAVSSALESGYRHIDAAYIYENEKDIGHTLKKWFAKGNKREDIFITTKLPIMAMRSTDVEKALELSLSNLGLDYIDMYLIHVPFGMKRTEDFQILKYDNESFAIDYSTNHFAIWRALEKQVKAGKVKSIGLSNFNKTQLLRLWNFAEIKPSNLQIESNVYLQQEELRELCQELKIVMTGYSPLGSGGLIQMRRKRETVVLPPLIKHPVVARLAEVHNKSPGQILLRFGLQRNIVVIPKSTNPKRIKENIDIFNFALTEEEMNKLKSLDQHGKYRKFDFLSLTGIEHHPDYPFPDKFSK
ncbi:1,5-anhydro-D-fructose reductase-like [Phymastichus coffea]|uniref:1,5-anhydro-D-fructose reductase-like n=1 Tax=Phymastichus coffea TaxID=108790 RepID=UPI00273ACE37|nr:1,5-anhydro-D-fructose reductase-like [Phymastichus coffea]